MASDVRVPDLGEGIKSAKLIAWLKGEGDEVVAGEPIAELETDKTTMEVEAPASGVLEKIHVLASDRDVAIDTVLAIIGSSAPKADPAREPVEAGRGAPADVDRGRRIHAAEATEAAGGAADRDAPPYHEPERIPDAGVEDARATPLARRMALIAGIALSDIPGSGVNGRISKIDVDTILRRRDPPSPFATASVIEETPGAFEVQPLSTVQRVTAERLLQSKQTIPHFYLRVDCQVDDLFEMRRDLNARPHDTKLSVTVFVIRAAAIALTRVPQANSTWSNGTVRLYESVDIAVAVDTPAGLMTPIIRGAQHKSLLAIARELEALTGRARAGRLRPADYNGGTFTISNLGMYGVTSLYPIVNPPQSAIHGVGAIERRPVVRGDTIAAGRMMTCTLSADHRSIDGATGARFLDEFRRQIEDVLWMVL
jgi:pyruvate dehydrogenase E2 component (dihydrolipoamide acetyltransferase)